MYRPVDLQVQLMGCQHTHASLYNDGVFVGFHILTLFITVSNQWQTLLSAKWAGSAGGHYLFNSAPLQKFKSFKIIEHDSFLLWLMCQNCTEKQWLLSVKQGRMTNCIGTGSAYNGLSCTHGSEGRNRWRLRIKLSLSQGSRLQVSAVKEGRQQGKTWIDYYKWTDCTLQCLGMRFLNIRNLDTGGKKSI